MKKTIISLIAGLVAMGGAYAQIAPISDRVEYTELVSNYDNSTSQYLTRNAAYSVDEAGRVSGSIISLHENGKLEETGVLRKGLKHGDWTKYNVRGKKISEAYYIDGQKDGLWKVWDEEGVLRVEMEYDKGKRVGNWKFFDENGKLLNEKSYE